MRFILFYFIVVFALPVNTYCQQVSLFQTLTVKDGLPSNFVFDASEDENGFLWIATDKGIAKHDGFTWQVINTDIGLPGNYIGLLACDKKGGIWLSVGAKGIYYYHIKKKKFLLVLKKPNISDFKMGKNGELYVLDNDKEKNNFSLNEYTPENDFKKTIIYEMPFVGCDTCKYSFDVDYVNKKILQYFTTNNYKNANDWVVEKKQRIHGNYLWGSNKDSIFYDVGKIIIKENKTVTNKKIFSQKGYFYFTSYDASFYCWNIQDGFWQFDTKGNFKNYTTANGLTTNLVNKIVSAKNKKLLVCTLGGGLQMLLPTQNTKIGTGEKLVRAIACSNNKAYVCTENKLMIINLLNATVEESLPIEENFVESIAINNDEINIGSLTGINTYKIKNHALIKTNSIKVGAGVSTVLANNEGYIASTYGSGILFFDKQNIQTFKNVEAKYTIIEKLQTLTVGYAGTTLEDGVHIFDKNFNPIKTITRNDGLQSNEVYDVHEHNDSLWICTARGVSVFTKNKLVQNISLPTASITNKCIYSFHTTDNKYWVVSNGGLYAYNNNKLNTVGSYPIINNATDKINTANYNTATNTLVVGTSSEISLIKMESIQKDNSVLPPSLWYSFSTNRDNVLDSNFNLPYNFKTISFSFAPALSNPFSPTKILYSLEGFNDNFQLLKDSSTVSFAKLRPGNYNLFAKTINADDDESKTVLLMSFTVQKPYWQQLWFILISSFLVVGGSIVLFNYFQRKKQLQKDKANALALSVSKERERISKDLHDHLGTSLVTMIAQTDNIENKLINNNVADALLKVQQLSDQSRESMNVLRETIWAVQENSHTLAEFTLRVRTFLQRVMDAHEMAWALECNGTLHKDLSAEQTLHLFRMLQEVTQNIIKHAAASYAQYKIDASTNVFKITITDNGKGFDTNAIYTSNGLKNLAARIKELDGTIDINSAIEKGTTIIVQLSI